MSCKRIFYVVLLCIGHLAGLLVANRPRFWWQDLFQNTALYWIVPAVCAAVWIVLQMWVARRWSWLAAGACLAYVASSYTMLDRVWPYISFHRWAKQSDSSVSSISGVWIDSWAGQDDAGELRTVIARLRPNIVVVSGTNLDSINQGALTADYPYRVRLRAEQSREIELLSQLPFGKNAIFDLGINAEVGGFIPLVAGATKTVQLGLLDLVHVTNSANFERKRISSRRLSALVRNSADTRIVVGQFSTTPFSQLMSLYTQQARVRSLRFNSGLPAALRTLRFCQTDCPAQVFVSKDVVPEIFEEFPIAGRNQSGLYFKVMVPPW